MRMEGHLRKSGRFWLAEVPMLDAMTQGRTRKEALEMIGDWVETMIDRADFRSIVHAGRRNEFEIEGTPVAPLIALMLRRQRESRGLTLAEMAETLDARSRNAWARYEQGRAVPRIDKLDELLRAVSASGDFVIRDSSF